MPSEAVGRTSSTLHLLLMLLVIALDAFAIYERYEHLIGELIPKLAIVSVLIVPVAFLFFITNIQRKVRFKRFWRHLSKALLLIAIAAVVFILIPRKVVSSKLPVVVADLDDQTEDQAFRDIGGRALLAIALQQSPRLAVFPEARINDALSRMGRPLKQQVSVDVGREICQREGVGPLVSWKVYGSRAEYTLNSQIIDPVSGNVLSEVNAGPSSGLTLVEAVGLLGEKIRKSFGDSSWQIYKTSKPLVQATTPSLPALKAYSDAIGYMYERKYPEARASLSNALELDANFALALVEMASLYDLEGHTEAAAATAKRAFELRDRLTEPEKVRVDEFYYWVVLNDHKKAFAVVSEFLERYPRNQERLGTLVYHAIALMDFETAEDASMKLLGAPPWGEQSTEDAFALWRTQLSLNKFSQAIDTANEIAKVEKINAPYMVLIPSLGLGDQQQSTRLLAEIRQAGNMEAASWLGGVHDLYKGNLPAASNEWKQYIELTNQRAASERRWIDPGYAYLGLARIAFIAGEFDQVKINLANVQGVRDEYMAEVGKYYARIGEPQKANEILADLRARLQGKSTDQNRALLLLLESEIELANGNRDTSFTLISQANYPWSDLYWQLQETRIYISLATNNFKQAIETGLGMLNRKGLAFASDRPDDWVMAHYYVGRAYESLGQKDEATAYYLDFDRLWAKGDSKIPPLRYVRTQVPESRR